MRVIIAGSRSINKYSVLKKAIEDSGFKITSVVSGCARGADELGIAYAQFADIPCERFPANWNKHGKSAGILRNVEMSENADALIALWDGKSRGTSHMIEIAKKKGLKVFVFRVDTVSNSLT